MKEIAFVLIILATSVALNKYASPSENERHTAQWQRQAREEQEQMTRELLTMREDITLQLKEVKNQSDVVAQESEQRLETLRKRVEQENRELKLSAKEVKKLTRTSWSNIKDRAEKQISIVKRDFQRVQRKMEGAVTSN